MGYGHTKISGVKFDSEKFEGAFVGDVYFDLT